MRAFLRFLAVLCAIVFVPTVVVIVFFHPVATRLPKAQYYKEALARSGAHERLAAVSGEIAVMALEQMARASDQGPEESKALSDTLEAVQQMSARDWEILLQPVLPPKYVKAELGAAIDELCGLAFGDPPPSERKVSLVEVKQRLAGPEMEAAYMRMLDGKPPCTDAQWTRSGGVPLDCRPNGEQMYEAVSNFSSLVKKLAEGMPDEIDLLGELRRFATDGETSAQLEAFREKVRLAGWVASWIVYVPVALAVLIVLMAVRSLRDLLLWWGIPAFIAGFVATLIALPFMFVGGGAVGELATAQLPPDVPVEVVKMVLDVTGALFAGIAQPALQAALALLVGGCVGMVLGLILKKKPVTPATA